MNKKLQVFVSSTYTDLKEERQAAVQAILDAGHIPAGMELFKAGKSQMETIRKWIDESDIYMLILGGRYGSIEEESGLSYTELEYQYALRKNMPVFAIVLSETFLEKKILSLGLCNVIEHTDKYKAFKKLVMTKIIRTVNDCKDIQLAIHTTLNDFIHEYNLTGWTKNINNYDFIEKLISLYPFFENYMFQLERDISANAFFCRYINAYINGYTQKSNQIIYDYYTNIYLQKGILKVTTNKKNEKEIKITDFGYAYYQFILFVRSQTEKII
ncbi:MAG: DUF4062 domain-containing protein [Lachnospiraceae bacterium]|nr:DUF4062 domain-containing protein [Lachnospiraceae bacterium]